MKPRHVVLFAIVPWLLAAALSGASDPAPTAPASPATTAAVDTGPIAKITSGQIRGFMDNGINVFKGIPYGDDTAKHRFQPSVPPTPWTGVRDALEFGTPPPQNGARGGDASSEDCLNLNVWTPAMRDGKKRPVVVYFHGGAYNGGSVNDNLYDGVHLCKRGDVVVVTVNGRLNILGFLYLGDMAPEFKDSGNVGMLDLILALQWIHDNIAEFGGDPGSVTIFGQSGGGAKCATLMAMPAAQGLFQHAWSMSGQQVTGRTLQHAKEDAQKVITALGLTKETIGQIKTLPVDQIEAVTRNGNWNPVVDGGALPRDPFAPDATPISKDIPFVMGNTHDETRYLIGGSRPQLFELTWDGLPAAITQNIPQFIGNITPDEIVAEYRKLYPNYTATDVFFSATTAARSWKGYIIESEARAKQNGPTYLYNVYWPSPADGGKWKAPHMIDIPLVFDNIEQSNYTAGSADAQKLADLMADSMIAFARTGNPNTPALPKWPRFDLEHRATMIFDLPPKVEDDPRGEERKFFAPAIYIQPGT